MQNLSYLELLKLYNDTLTLSPKERYKKIRSVAYLAEKALKTVSDVDELAFYAKIFKMMNNSKLLTKAKVKEFELRGITEIKTLKTKLGTVNIESGILSVGDPTLGYQSEYNLDDIIKKMNQNDFFCVGTAGDGKFDITLRLIDIEEPLIGPKEYKYIIDNTNTSVIKITSGYIKCADFWDISESDINGVGFEIENGYYKTAFYLKEVKNKYFGFVVVLSKTKDLTSNKLTEIEDLC